MAERSLDAHVALRLSAFERHPSFVATDGAARSVREHLETLHGQGVVRSLEEDGEHLAVLAWREADHPFFGQRICTVAFDQRVEPRHAERVERWLDAVLGEELPQMQVDLDLSLDRAYGGAYRVLKAHGLGIDSVVLLGRPEVALERLRASSSAALSLPPNLRIEPMVTSHIDAVLALQRATFVAEPQFCFFGANEAYLEGCRERLVTELTNDPTHLQRVLFDGQDLVGHVSATVDHDRSFWGATAGMSLLLSPVLRGQGLLRPLYGYLLEGMVERGARTFKGGTSQPAVLRLGKIMGRPLHTALMRRQRFFDEAHFGDFVPG